ncbi:MAG TPA: hypothetical protein VHZ76_06665 [Gammaproteobacteria bacterium]|jgi:hypothetical protein|nr:hypothetical protein [Gammaproteobacteria bacterium]
MQSRNDMPALGITPHESETFDIVNIDQNDRNNFYSPIVKAKSSILFSQSSCTYKKTLLSMGEAAMASSAVLLVVEPSIEYAEDNLFDQVTIPTSTVITGFLINLFAIRYLLEELRNVQDNKNVVLLSCLLGLISALPFSFMQLMQGQDISVAYAIVTAILVGIGSIPLQALGFFDFIEDLWPYFQYLYYRYISSSPNAPQIVVNFKERYQFLEHLENGINYCVTNNKIPIDYLDHSDEDLLIELFNSHRKSLMDKKITLNMLNPLGILLGICGVILSESINISFAKTTYVSLASKSGNILSSILTTCIVFPLVVLSAEFGYNALYRMYGVVINSVEQLINSIKNREWKFKFKPPLHIDAMSGIIALIATIIIGSRSYSGLVQLNIDTFEDSLTDEQLDILNTLTKMGGLIFNIYAIQHIVNDASLCLIVRYGNENNKEKVVFYQFGLSVVKEYKRMNHNLLFLKAKEFYQLESGTSNTNSIELASMDNSFSPI